MHTRAPLRLYGSFGDIELSETTPDVAAGLYSPRSRSLDCSLVRGSWKFIIT